MDSETVHESNRTVRRITSGAVTYEWEIVDRDQEDAVEGYEWAGEGDPSDSALDALKAWIEETHDVELDRDDVDDSAE